MGGLEADVNPEQQYSLRWNDFHASILSSFRHLRDEEDFVDVTLACDGCSFTAHKVVLSACSPYFRKLLKANPCQHPIVILRDVQQKDMESLLRFMYNGEVHIGQEQLADFLKTAQMLQVRGLADVPAGVPNQRIVTAPDQKISPSSTSLPWPTDLQSPRGRDSGSPPPLKRSRSSDQPTRGTYSPDRVRTPSRGNGAEMRESLLGQALEGGPTLHTNTNSTNQKGNNSESSLQAQSTGEDSNSSSTALSDRGGPVTPKTEPSDYPMLEDHPLLNTNGSGPGPGMMDQSRTFPGALLGLQGISGLLPGPSGMHNNGPESFETIKEETLEILEDPLAIKEEVLSHAHNYFVTNTSLSVVTDDEFQLKDTADKTLVQFPSIDYCEPEDIIHFFKKYSNNRCQYCNKVYSTNSNLRHHVRNVHIHAQQLYPCSICGKTFRRKHYLHMHKYRVHGIRRKATEQL